MRAQFFNILCAFGHFAGKPLKATDGADYLFQEDLDSMEKSLRKLAKFYATQNDFPELITLSEQITTSLER